MTTNNRTPHKHAELIHAWADGASVQYWCGDEWSDIDHPHWYEDYQYRIKPKVSDLDKYGVEVGDVWSTGSGGIVVQAFNGSRAVSFSTGYSVTISTKDNLIFRQGVVNKLQEEV